MKDERLGPIGDERYLRYARDIHESARHALLVVERILGAPMTDSHVTDLSFTNLDLNDVIKALGSSVEQLAVDAVVALQLRLAPRLPLVVADATSIRQIILNLLTNALKFTPRGGTVTISTQAQPGGPLVIEVSDTGPGMSGEEIAKAMQDTSPETVAPRPSGGLGIGLPLARQLAMANGADLTINSPKHGGTQIRLIFPLSRQIPI